ncbi:MAG: sigma-E processing peptidase SpoIIGA [Clostridia bacterium]|nr:sigma-E processing peptidase SpoIIGA [Clostridia bacterium]
MIKITIYIDIIFLENLIMNSIILYATAVILKIKPKTLRVIASSTIGSIYAIITYVTEIYIFTSVILKAILAIIMVYVAFNPQNIKRMWKQVAIFYLTSFVFGGVALYLIYYIKPQEVFMKNAVFVGEYVLKVIMLGAIVAFITIKISLKIIKTKINPKDMYCKIKIKLQGQKIETKAMIDTGNLAKEPITNAPVVIVESSLLEDILPNKILNNLENILGGDLSQISEEMQEKYISKLRCIPFSSLGKQNGMLLGIRAEEVEIETDDEKKTTNNVIIGIYDKSLTKRGEYRALIGIELI